MLLDEVDKELERRGHAFVRYADDLNVYVRTQRSGERVMASLRKLFGKLKLRVNETKSKVRRATASKFLGFSFWTGRGRTIRRRVAPQAIKRMKERVRELTRRNAGRSLAQICKPLGVYLTGWKGYFRLAETPGVFADIDAWVRHRLRAVQLKHWKRGRVIYREMIARGAYPRRGQTSCRQQPTLVAQLGDSAQHGAAERTLQPTGSPKTCQLTSTHRTARCGPACRVVWQGTWRQNLHAPMPISRDGID